MISNSYKYTDKGEILIELLLEHCVEFGRKMILVKISDTGKGIPDDILNNWGKPFGFKDKSKGTGLGQFIITTIANNLGFYIPKPESKIGVGTIIKIYIPYDDESDMLSPEIKSKRQSKLNEELIKLEPIEEKTYFIMCLDDDGLILNSLRNIMSRMLNRNYKFEIILVDSVAKFFIELFELLNNNKLIDIFIMDQNINNMLTGMDCADIVTRLYRPYILQGNDYYRFYFVTEDVINIKYLIDGFYKDKFSKDNIFTKSQFKELCNDINRFINTDNK
jgi:hypothetical protein